MSAQKFVSYAKEAEEEGEDEGDETAEDETAAKGQAEEEAEADFLPMICSIIHLI